MPESPPIVYLIGAGPGDPGLLTLRGKELLARADVVLYDYLVNPQILQLTRADAELVCLGRHGTGRIRSQPEIHQLMIDAVKAGQRVARLKGGDTTIFARTSEECAALEEAGIGYEIVPGITAVQAASAATGIPLTHRDHASSLAVITGQQGSGAADPLDMEAVARFPGTVAIYMGVTTAPTWAATLIALGKPADTPVAVVRHASLPRQEVITTTLGEVAQELVAHKIRPPAVILVGPTVSARAGYDWFTARPLHSVRVLVTRPAHQAEAMIDRLQELGAETFVQPAIEIGPPAEWAPVDAALAQLDRFDWVVFSSTNGVDYFLDRLEALGRDLRSLAGMRIAAIGSATADRLREYRLHADLVPLEYRAEALAEALREEDPQGRYLLVRASRGREVLADTLRNAGAQVTQIVVYTSRDVETPDPEILELLQAGKIDWTTATSSAIARSLHAMLGDALHSTKLVAISPITAAVLSEAGYQVAAVAEDYTTDGVIKAILQG